jgi:hypothetical protein
MDALQPIGKPRMFATESASRGHCLDREAHLDVGSSEFPAGKPVAILQLAFQILQMLPD